MAALAAYALVCALSAGCVASDGTTQPQGTVMQGPVAWDGVTPYNPPGMSVVPWTGQSVYTPAPAAPAVPQSVAMWQLQIAMSQMSSKSNAGKTVLDDANTLAAAAGGATLLAWQHADTVARTSPTINAMAPQLGLAQSDVDALFVAAAQVQM